MNIYKLLVLIFTFSSSVFSSVLIADAETDDFISHFIEHEKIKKEEAELRLQNLMQTWEGFVLVYGWHEAKDCGYDVSLLSMDERNLAIEAGLFFLSMNVDNKEQAKLNTMALANYYLEKKDYKKAMYWAFKGAENGCPQCMMILSNAYRSGVGLVQDFIEGVKWIYLGAAVGEKSCLNWLNENISTGMTNSYIAPVLIEGQKRASQWMSEHPEIFISLD